MSTEIICDRVTGAICRRIEADFGEELGVSAEIMSTVLYDLEKVETEKILGGPIKLVMTTC
jgi:hypothetical protein